MLLTDFSAKTLQGRRNWHNIFKEMKRGKPITKNTLSGNAFIQIRQNDQKVYRQAKAKGAQPSQNSFTRNVKETSLSEKEKIATRTRKIMKGKTSWVKAHRQ